MSDSGALNIDFKAIAAEVKENHSKRRACPQHTFPLINQHKFGAKLTCTHCGSWMSVGDAISYVEGFRAAGGDPEAVWPGYGAQRRAAP